jgi:hypothetical protein
MIQAFSRRILVPLHPVSMNLTNTAFLCFAWPRLANSNPPPDFPSLSHEKHVTLGSPRPRLRLASSPTEPRSLINNNINMKINNEDQTMTLSSL